MGKCGAQELNYIWTWTSSSSPNCGRPRDALGGEFINIGSRVFFEVDAALRPEGKRGALVRTLDSHVNYYRRWARPGSSSSAEPAR